MKTTLLLTKQFNSISTINVQDNCTLKAVALSSAAERPFGYEHNDYCYILLRS